MKRLSILFALVATAALRAASFVPASDTAGDILTVNVDRPESLDALAGVRPLFVVTPADRMRNTLFLCAVLAEPELDATLAKWKAMPAVTPDAVKAAFPEAAAKWAEADALIGRQAALAAKLKAGEPGILFHDGKRTDEPEPDTMPEVKIPAIPTHPAITAVMAMYSGNEVCKPPLCVACGFGNVSKTSVVYRNFDDEQNLASHRQSLERIIATDPELRKMQTALQKAVFNLNVVGKVLADRPRSYINGRPVRTLQEDSPKLVARLQDFQKQYGEAYESIARPLRTRLMAAVTRQGDPTLREVFAEMMVDFTPLEKLRADRIPAPPPVPTEDPEKWASIDARLEKWRAANPLSPYGLSMTDRKAAQGLRDDLDKAVARRPGLTELIALQTKYVKQRGIWQYYCHESTKITSSNYYNSDTYRKFNRYEPLLKRGVEAQIRATLQNDPALLARYMEVANPK